MTYNSNFLDSATDARNDEVEKQPKPEVPGFRDYARNGEVGGSWIPRLTRAMTPYRTTAGCGLTHIARNVFYAGFLKTFPAQTAGVAASAGQSRVRGPIAGYGLGIVHPQLRA